MKKIETEGMKDKKKYDIEISELVMGSGDFLRLDNLERIPGYSKSNAKRHTRRYRRKFENVRNKLCRSFCIT